MQSLENKTVIITGGSKGIGRVLALRLAKEKSNLVIVARNKEDLEKTKKEIQKINNNVIAINADVSINDDVKRIVNETIKQFSSIEYLVNNAALKTHKELEDFSLEEWKKIIDVNLIGTYLMSKEVIPYMKKANYGNIINISSTSGKRGYETGTAYSSSKFALTGFSESLFKEVRQYNIRIITIHPSMVDTSVKDESKLKEIGKGVYLRAEDIADSIIFTMKLPQRALVKQIELWGTNP